MNAIKTSTNVIKHNARTHPDGDDLGTRSSGGSVVGGSYGFVMSHILA